MKFNARECRRGSECHYHHGCAFRLGNGRPCIKTTQQRITKDPPDSRIHHQQSLRFQMPKPACQFPRIYGPRTKTSDFYQPHCHTITSDVTPNPTAIPEILSMHIPQSTHYKMIFPACHLLITHQRFFLDLFASHSAPLTLAAKAANLDHFCPFDIEFNHLCNILDDSQFENLLKLAHSGLIGAIWSAPACKLCSRLREDDGGPTSLAY